MNNIIKPIFLRKALLRSITFQPQNNPRKFISTTSPRCTRFLKLRTIVYHGAAKLKWIPCCNGARPPGAVEAGYDNETKSRLFVVRAHHKEGIYPGMLNAAKERAVIAVYGREHLLDTYEVLVAPYNSISWVPGPPVGMTLPNAIIGGVSDTGETLFIGRALHHGMLSVGKIHGSHGVCYVPSNGSVCGYKEFEILVQNQWNPLNTGGISELD